MTRGESGGHHALTDRSLSDPHHEAVSLKSANSYKGYGGTFKKPSYRAHSATRRLPRFLIGHPVLSVQQAAAGLSISVPAANAALNNLLAAGIVSLVNERVWGRVFQATQVLQRLDQLPAPRRA